LADAYTREGKPSQTLFMTVILTFEDVSGKTRHTNFRGTRRQATAKHTNSCGFMKSGGYADHLAARVANM
jgi:hypothetical protein